MKTKRTEITIETEEFHILRGALRSARAWCGECQAEVRMMSVDEAATAAGVNERTIYRWVESGKVHFMETLQGSLLVCLASLRDRGANVI